MVVEGKLVAAARKDTASVTGDGIHTIAELMERENRDPRRIAGVELRLMLLDEETDRTLARQGCTRATVPEAGRVVRVKGTANFAKGGEIVDVLDSVHPDNARLAIRAAEAIGLKVAGIDFICPDIPKSWRQVGGGICEVNTTVDLHSELRPSRDGDVRDVLLQSLIRKATTAAYRSSW